MCNICHIQKFIWFMFHMNKHDRFLNMADVSHEHSCSNSCVFLWNLSYSCVLFMWNMNQINKTHEYDRFHRKTHELEHECSCETSAICRNLSCLCSIYPLIDMNHVIHMYTYWLTSIMSYIYVPICGYKSCHTKGCMTYWRSLKRVHDFMKGSMTYWLIDTCEIWIMSYIWKSIQYCNTHFNKSCRHATPYFIRVIFRNHRWGTHWHVPYHYWFICASPWWISNVIRYMSH